MPACRIVVPKRNRGARRLMRASQLISCACRSIIIKRATTIGPLTCGARINQALLRRRLACASCPMRAFSRPRTHNKWPSALLLSPARPCPPPAALLRRPTS